MGTELTGKTIAAEAGLVERTVSFTKGCYTGQELVARIDSRGSNVARRLVGIVGRPAAAVPLTRGMTLHGGGAPSGDGAAEDKVVGTITSAAWSPRWGHGWPWAPAPQHRGSRPGAGALGRRRRRVAAGPGRGSPWWRRPAPGRAEARAAPVPDTERSDDRRPRRRLFGLLLVAMAGYALGAATTTAFTQPANV